MVFTLELFPKAFAVCDSPIPGWAQGEFLFDQGIPIMANQIMVIVPYWEAGTWVFDDPATDLVKEPFVAGVPEMIDDLVADIPNARQGFRLLFSAAPFPGFQRKLTRLRQEFEGWWYASDDPSMEGWLCPALFRYFDEAPGEVYVKAEAKGR